MMPVSISVRRVVLGSSAVSLKSCHLNRVDQVDEMPNVHGLYGAPGWHGEFLALGGAKRAMAAALVNPGHVISFRDGLKLSDAPVPRVAAHLIEQFSGPCHLAPRRSM